MADSGEASPKTPEDPRPSRPSGFRASLSRYMLALGLLLAAGALMLVFSHAGHAFFPGYRDFSKALMEALASIAGLAPFSLWDWLAIPLALILLVSLVVALVRSRSLWRWLANVLVVAAAMVLFLVGGWGLNHYAPPLSEELDLAVGRYSAEELAQATEYYLVQAASLAPEVPRAEDGSLERQDFYELARLAGRSYVDLGKDYPVFQGSQAPVKALLLAGEPLLYWGATGIFWPFTGEANVPLNCAVAPMPFTMSHEAAHRLGIASEQEANFAAFLACTSSEDVRFAYAGYYEAFGYCYNALVANYPEHAKELLKRIVGDEPDFTDPLVAGVALLSADREATFAHYQAYEGPVEEIGTAANDAYLKTFDQEEGIKSYGLVTDYLIAWYQHEVRTGA